MACPNIRRPQNYAAWNLWNEKLWNVIPVYGPAKPFNFSKSLGVWGGSLVAAYHLALSPIIIMVQWKIPFKRKETNIGVTHFSLPWLWDLWDLKHYGHLRVLTISRYDPQYFEEMYLTQIRPKRQKKAKQKSANRCRWRTKNCKNSELQRSKWSDHPTHCK